MLNKNKLDEIQLNFDTINMLKELNYSNEDILKELSDTLTSYSTELLNCLCNNLNNSLYQSILLRLKLQEKLKLNNDKLLKSFNNNLHPLINYLLCNDVEKPVEKTVEKPVEKPVETESETDSDSNDNVDLSEYMESCVVKEKGNFLSLDNVYDDYSEWHEAEEKNDKLEKDNFSKLFQKNSVKLHQRIK